MGITAAEVSVPFVSHTLVHFLGIDVMDSDVDPLCGVLNRRGFIVRPVTWWPHTHLPPTGVSP